MSPTARQLELLRFIASYMAREAQAPTICDMMAGIGLASRGGAHEKLVGLEERGLIRRLPARARAIELTEAGTAMLRPFATLNHRNGSRTPLRVVWSEPVQARAA